MEKSFGKETVHINNISIPHGEDSTKNKKPPLTEWFFVRWAYPQPEVCELSLREPRSSTKLLVVDRVVARAEVFRRGSVDEACCRSCIT